MFNTAGSTSSSAQLEALERALTQTGLTGTVKIRGDEIIVVLPPGAPATPRTCGLIPERDPETVMRQLDERSITAAVTVLDTGDLELRLAPAAATAFTAALLAPIAPRVAAVSWQESDDEHDPWASAISDLREAMNTVGLSCGKRIEHGDLVLSVSLSLWYHSRFSSLRLPEPGQDTEAVRQALSEQGIEALVRAGLRLNLGHVDLVLHSPETIRTLASAILGPIMDYRAVKDAVDLKFALARLRIVTTLQIRDGGRVILELTDNEGTLEKDLRELAAALGMGANALLAGLDPDSPTDDLCPRITERLIYVISGATGGPVDTAYEPGCQHIGTNVTFALSLPQTHRLTQALVATASSERQDMPARELTDRRRAILRALAKLETEGTTPTVRAIADMVGLKSRSATLQQLGQLARAGYVSALPTQGRITRHQYVIAEAGRQAVGDPR